MIGRKRIALSARAVEIANEGRMPVSSESRRRSQCEPVEWVYPRTEESILIPQSSLRYCVSARAMLKLRTLVEGYDGSEQPAMFGQTDTNL